MQLNLLLSQHAWECSVYHINSFDSTDHHLQYLQDWELISLPLWLSHTNQTAHTNRYLDRVPNLARLLVWHLIHWSIKYGKKTLLTFFSRVQVLLDISSSVIIEGWFCDDFFFSPLDYQRPISCCVNSLIMQPRSNQMVRRWLVCCSFLQKKSQHKGLPLIASQNFFFLSETRCKIGKPNLGANSWAMKESKCNCFANLN